MYTAEMKALLKSFCGAWFWRSFLLVGIGLHGAAFAQWSWVDGKGQKVFSDRAPPPEVPSYKILKKPSDTPASSNFQPAGLDTPTGSAAAPAPRPPTGIDPTLQERKKQQSDADTLKKKAEEERQNRALAENCARARQAKSGLESGIRVVRTNERGEREFMDDAARNGEISRLQTIIDSDCR